MNKKIFEVDWDDWASVNDLVTQCRSRLGNLSPNKLSKRERNQRLLRACQEIYSTDISATYKGLLDPDPHYRVIAHLDGSKPIAPGRHGVTTFGASIGMKFIPRLIEITDVEREPHHASLVVASGLTVAAAAALQGKLIDIFGLNVSGGFLTNLDEDINKDNRRNHYRFNFDLLWGNKRML